MKYQHYKGGIYTFIGVGKYPETREELVAYTDKYGELHFRPKDMFFQDVEVDGVIVPRFRQMADTDLLREYTIRFKNNAGKEE